MIVTPSGAESDPVCHSCPSTSELLSPYKGARDGAELFLPPNFIPRNSDLPRLKAASDWLMTRSACLICIKQLYGDGSDLLKGTGAHIKTWCSFIARLDMETMTSPDFIITR